MNAVEVLNNNLKASLDYQKNINGGGQFDGQIWTGSTPVIASADQFGFSMQRRDFDMWIRKITLYNMHGTNFTEQVGMTVKLTIGQRVIIPVAVDVSIFRYNSGMFIGEFLPVFAGKNDDIVFTFTNRLATAAIVDIALYGWKHGRYE